MDILYRKPLSDPLTLTGIKAKDILVLPTTATVDQILQYLNQRRNLARVLKRLLPTQKAKLFNLEKMLYYSSKVLHQNSRKFYPSSVGLLTRMLDKVRNMKIKLDNIVVPTFLYIIELLKETLLLGTNWFQKTNAQIHFDEQKLYLQDTFDKFDYEENEKIDEVEDYFIEEYHEENLVTNIEEFSKVKGQQIVKNDNLILQQGQEIKEFLFGKKRIFEQDLEDLDHAKIITHTINTREATLINQGSYKSSTGGIE
ncbi:3869_t:CDS:2 [Gigaspora margarita]|uniref:3869_t:CDS:1 n=1 Tax=Gigaspora margarita TaxID=4874 RepID=A0ABN7VB36_GIGMA|nr:3869_t:CDS:2 [Gigaspora margarita]